MSSEEVNKVISAVNKRIAERVKAIQDIMNEEVSKEMAKVNGDFVPEQKRIVRDVFNSAVAEWYGAYKPVRYKRRDSLYNLLADLDIDKSTGQLDYETADDLIDASKMAPDRHGNNEELYKVVFEMGFHGGATKITTNPEKWGYHPAEGTPYWRTVGWVMDDDGTMFKHRFGRWYDSPAFQSESPLDIFRRKLAEAEKGEMFERFCSISNEHNNKAMQRVNERIAKL